ncbi:DEAD/DEAH box helicase [Streptococcus danieliae]|uniref:DEAD/DEAH box helicase n=1 Tax=Streptococcus danieliae TaxID=747656 RepID=A0A7Z0M7J4_9STRE|nr:DEAD/DEAH box helicase [Streptococcus danieliae]MBF0700097.1 DEAD/DEAH box helicase [Streptococcus danieliae]NYS97273.1 DEAD/DEAH box helicase [Streptococcus danieliae]
MEDEKNYWGRRLPEGEWPESLKAKSDCMLGIRQSGGQWICQRCQTRLSQINRLPQGAFYCRACIQMGRLRSDESLYFLAQKSFPVTDSCRWSGELSPDQARIAQVLLEQSLQGVSCLVHAVTGAGKTEMLYPLLTDTLNKGGVVGLASPRIDVCRELHQRLQRDFTVSTCFLYGEGEPYQRSQLIVATVPQLFRFYQAFDLLIVDEVDAFPFDENPQLYAAVEQAQKVAAPVHFLTATTTPLLEQRIQRGDLVRLALPKRFHQQPLVVPRIIYWSGYQEKGRVSRTFLMQFRRQRQSGFPLLIFLPLIQWGENFYKQLGKVFPNLKVAFVSASSGNRKELVEQFRAGVVEVLITTTILERGVTFPKVDVFVLEADHALYTKSSLVQIAGRVGRSKERPDGLVLFFVQEQTRASKQAIQEIKQMNREAGF